MTWIVIVFGAVVAALGAVGLVRPLALLRLVESAWDSPAGYPLAIGMRLLLGAALLAAAPECRYPDAVRAIGVIALLAAGVGVALGRRRLQSFVAWWLGRPAGFVRGWSLVALAFGGFLVRAAA